MTNEYTNFAIEVYEVTNSKKLLQEIINIGGHNNIMGAFTEGDSNFFIVTIITSDSLFEIFYDSDDGTVCSTSVSSGVLSHVFSMGIHSMRDLIAFEGK
jgi:hypothetical protein